MAHSIRIFGDITDDGLAGVSLERVREEIGDNEGPLRVQINSGGGDVTEGFAIYQLLRSYNATRGPVTAVINSLAGSIAGVIALAADRRLMAPLARWMAHEPRGVAGGTIAEMASRVEMYKTLRDDLVDVYEQRLKMTRAAVEQMLTAETWLRGAEAIKAGVAHELTNDLTLAANVSAGVLETYRHPDMLPAAECDLENMRRRIAQVRRELNDITT